MELINIIFTLIWIPQAVAQIMLWTYWIQVKEYRFDRFKSFITSVEGVKKLKLVPIIIKIFYLTLALIFKFDVFLIIVLFIVIDAWFLYEIFSRRIRRPVFTQRMNKILLVSSISFILVFMLINYIYLYSAIIIGEFLLVIAPITGVMITIPVVNRVRQEEVQKAADKIKKIAPVVIGITGSYGKTTTKDFLTTILAQKYKVQKTKKNENTVFGVSRKIIKDLPKDTEVFVAEMGAYKKNEIKNIADMIKPQFGIITGIEPQHLELFGSLENIKDAKFELIYGLPEKGVAIFNLSNEDVRELYRRAINLPKNLKVYGYVLHKAVGKKYDEIIPDYESRILEANENGVSFEIYENGRSHKLFSPVTGIHFIENITGSVLVARLLNVPWSKIEKALKKLQLPERTMQVSNLGYGSILIDDSYNSTPKGFLSALNYLSYFKNKSRIIITPGIIELGGKSHGIHKKLGAAIENKTDYAIITNSQPAKYIKSGFIKNKDRLVVIENDKKLLSAVQQLIENGSVILIEGRISSSVYDYIMNRKK